MGRNRRRRRNRTRPSHQSEFDAYNGVASLNAADMNTDLVEEQLGGVKLEPRLPDMDTTPYARPSREDQKLIFSYFQRAMEPVHGGEWVNKPEIPTSQEIVPDDSGYMGEKIIDLSDEIKPNKVSGAYSSKEEYLGTQYQLLREDCIRPLRQAVNEVRKNPLLEESDYENNSIGIYEPTYLTSLIFSTRGLATRVAFSLGRVKKRIRWQQSKRLITGTLVALSPMDDGFRTKCVLATVAARPISGLDQNPPQIDLFFARPEEFEIDATQKWIMVENRSSFFEASRHTLLALQHMMREPMFPMSQYLVNVEQKVDAPRYVKDHPFTDLSSLVSLEESEAFENVNILKDWPSEGSHGLDPSQSKALKQMLTKEFAIVQGPPGTGKTFVSVVELKILLASHRKDDPPLLVTCQTNHALDQILRRVAEFEQNFIRLGGRSKDKDRIKKRTLYEVRSNNPPRKIPGSPRNKAMAQIKITMKEIQTLLGPLTANGTPLDHRLLVQWGLLTEAQANSLELEPLSAMGINQHQPGILMEQWLGKNLGRFPGPVKPDSFGLDFENDDNEVEDLKELEAEAFAEDDDDMEILKGDVLLLGHNYAGIDAGSSLTTDKNIETLLRNTRDLTKVRPAERVAVYNYFVREVKRRVLDEVRTLVDRYQQGVQRRKIAQWQQDLQILRQQRIVGMTTTGLSKYRGLIAALNPRVVMVEEAAETLEAPITAACLPSLQHLILVGDHQQLRPHCQSREFEEEPFHFNLSLFERMVDNGIEKSTLKSQRRMLPEIRKLLIPIYGDLLKDHASVKDVSNRPPVKGMGGTNSFLFHHEFPESRDANMSLLNEREADMIVGFIDYLVLNGEDSKKITVLSFYNGQRKTITKKLRQHANLGETFIEVVTVDSYQGEENDIVLLSLARNNKMGSIGFLSNANRICVALSRAKRGFYMFGNGELLTKRSETWEDVVAILLGDTKLKYKDGTTQRAGTYLPLMCQKHERDVFIEDPDDWQRINGGCYEACGCRLQCGHPCGLKCHPFDNSLINCTKPCQRQLPCNHRCMALCCDPCKCEICSRRSNGMRSLLKTVPRNDISHGGQGQLQSPFANSVYQGPHPPQAPVSNTEAPGSTQENWITTVQADDARMRQKRMDEEAAFEASMTAKTEQKSETLESLLDLDVGSVFSAPKTDKTKAASKTKCPTNLLD